MAATWRCHDVRPSRASWVYSASCVSFLALCGSVGYGSLSVGMLMCSDIEVSGLGGVKWVDSCRGYCR
jgi:hypothetical protein